MSDGSVPRWPQLRSTLHRLQGVAEPPQGWVETIDPPDTKAADALVAAAAKGYLAAFPDGDLVEFDDHSTTYMFDLADDPTKARSPSVVAAWRHSAVPRVPRDRSRQAGFPLSKDLIARGYERGHLLSHASSGELDENLFPQSGHVNQGRSPAGRVYRRLERLAVRHPGCFVFHRLIYGDGTDIPDLTHLVIRLPNATHAGTFDNRPDAWASHTDRLVRGPRFHRTVQTAFLAGLVAADAHPEHILAIGSGRRRVDMLVLPRMAGEVTAVVVEIKNTDWDALRVERVRPNLRRHLRQLQDYLDHYVDHLRTGGQPADTSVKDPGSVCWDAVIGVLLYPKQPRDPRRALLIERLAMAEAITVVWHDRTHWHDGPGQSSRIGSADSRLSVRNS